ncbi:unnamed protein product [Tetraodon nigroviridis]|uniref:(spotted green pufferfish) hypothetical protein n=1 Tax=Tetraodon nigroviridis TaxID=99883 RepID=Q4RSF3_TETNG|nr:unnamed protein product [Tetraodon nigroviridis]
MGDTSEPAVTIERRRSVSHAQLMHDKGRSLQDFSRRMWLHQLLEGVHTANEETPPVQSRTGTQTFSGNSLHEKPPGATKNLPDKFVLDRESTNLPQETNKALAYKDQPHKLATKRKKKARYIQNMFFCGGVLDFFSMFSLLTKSKGNLRDASTDPLSPLDMIVYFCRTRQAAALSLI